MSKAFTKESDREDDDDGEETGPALPPGTKNYITPSGLKKLQDELRHLKTKERPHYVEIVSWAASLGDRSENADYLYGKRKLREIDRRIRFLGKRLDNIEVVDPTKVKADSVRFGATVTIRDEDGSDKTYTIVGIDETDIDRGRISWISPLANALFKAQIGDYVTFKTPKGVREVEVVDIQYVAIENPAEELPENA
jgi:transcription elongation factor GreB